MEETICEAIRNKTEIAISISGAGKTFEFQPYVLWRDASGAKLAGYKITSIGIYPPNTVWEALAVSDIGDVVNLSRRLFPKPLPGSFSKPSRDLIICD